MKIEKNIVSGAGGEIGFFITEQLIKKGIKVVALDKKFSEEQKKVFDKSKTFFYELDLSDEHTVDTFFSQFHDELFDVSVLINNAGLIHSEPIFNIFNDEKKHSVTTWQNVINSNLKTSFVLSSFVIENMVSSRTTGCIINLSSISARGNKGQTAYSAAKAGLEAMTKVWASELGALNIRVNSIAPGFIDTLSTRQTLPSNIIDTKIKETPLKRLGEKAEVFNAIEFIKSNEFLTGEILNLNGGLLI